MDSSNITPFKCIVCDTSFKTKSGANRHYRTSHVNGSKYCCPTCDYKASRSDTLKKHMDKHTIRSDLMGRLSDIVQNNNAEVDKSTAMDISELQNATNKATSDENKVTSTPVLNNEQNSTLNWPEINALLANQNNHAIDLEQPRNTLLSTSYGDSNLISASQASSFQHALTSTTFNVGGVDVVIPLSLPNIATPPTKMGYSQAASADITKHDVALAATKVHTPAIHLDPKASDDHEVSVSKTAHTIINPQECSDTDEDLEEGIIEMPPMEHTPPQPMPEARTLANDINSAQATESVHKQDNMPKQDNDIIKLQDPGVQLTVFNYNVLPTVGHTYKVNKDYHLEKIKYPTGQLYQANQEGILEQVQYLPYQVYQADQEGILTPLGVVGGIITKS